MIYPLFWAIGRPFSAAVTDIGRFQKKGAGFLFEIPAQGIAHGAAFAQGILSDGMAFCTDMGFQTSYEMVVGSFKSAVAIEEKIKIFKNFKRSIKYFGVSPI